MLLTFNFLLFKNNELFSYEEIEETDKGNFCKVILSLLSLCCLFIVFSFQFSTTVARVLAAGPTSANVKRIISFLLFSDNYH